MAQLFFNQRFIMKFITTLVLLGISFAVFGQPEDFFSPPEVSGGISWEDNPIGYIVLLIVTLFQWGLILLVGFFLVKAFVGVLKGTNEYLNSRSGDDADTGKLIGVVVILFVGLIMWAVIFGLFEKAKEYLEGKVTESQAYIEYTPDVIEQEVNLSEIQRTA